MGLLRSRSDATRGGDVMAGQVVHFEIPTDNMDRAREFYREAFGWKLEPVPEMSYTMVTTAETDDEGMLKEPGAINGGMFPREESMTAPTVVINVDSIDQTLERVRTLGGQVVRERTPVADMGFSAYFRDPEGNVVGLWETADGRA